MRWKIACATMNGIIHQSNGTKCQDWIYKHFSQDLACVTMADGAGSVSRAFEGAELAVKESSDILTQLGQQLFSMTKEEIGTALLSHLNKRMEEACQRYHCRKGELASTLLFFANNGKQYVAGNIGDGMVGSIGNDGSSEIILDQERGEYSNYSFFLTDNDSPNHLHITTGDYDTGKVYFLITDGSCECLYNFRDKSFAKAIHEFARWLKAYPTHIVREAILQNMHRLFPKRTNDDCAIALLTSQTDKECMCPAVPLT